MSIITEMQAGLTQQQITQYWEDGFLVIDDVLTPAEVEQLREASESPALGGNKGTADYAKSTVHNLGLCAKHPAFMDLAKHPRLLSYLTPLLGPDIQIQHSKLATKPPTKGAGPIHWHQDFAFFPHTNTDLLAVMVMLDDATVENGCMKMVRGSHKLGMLDHTRDGLFSGACQETSAFSDPSRIVDITPRAGGISIHHGLTLHASEGNLSGRPRRGLVIQYRADDAYQLADGVWEDTGVLVCGRRRERVRCDAGVIRLPKTRRYGEDCPFGHAWNQEGTLARQRDHFADPVD